MDKSKVIHAFFCPKETSMKKQQNNRRKIRGRIKEWGSLAYSTKKA